MSFEMLEDRFRDWAAADLSEIQKTSIPFGKYGPANFPPSGKKIYDLPLEYLLWFSRKGFPQGRLGELLRMVYQMKADGCDETFDHFRRQNR